MLLTKSSVVAKSFFEIVHKNLDPKLVGKLEDRLTIVADSYKFLPDIVDIHNIKMGRAPEYYAVHFDSEFVIGFYDTDDMRKTMLKFWQSMLELEQAGKITLSIEEKRRQEENEKIEAEYQKMLERNKREKTIKKLKANKSFNQLKSTDEKEIVASATLDIVSEEAKKKPGKAI